MYVSGCSGGGVLSSWVIGHTDRFAAAAVRCPVIDWISMAGQTDVPLFTYSFFKKPFWEDPSDWLAHSSLMYVGKVTTPTLLMTGVLDRRTPMPQTEEFYSALKMRGVPAKLLQFDERVPRHRVEAVELHAHAALHDELVQSVDEARRAARSRQRPTNRSADCGLRIADCGLHCGLAAIQ